MFSKSCEYGLKAVIYIYTNSKDKRRLNISEIAKGTNSPMHYTSKILQSLVHHQIIKSTKGPKGGFYFDETQTVTVLELIKAIDGNDFMTRCSMGLKGCNDAHPCPIHNEFKIFKNRLLEITGGITINDLANKISSGEAFLKNT